MTVVHRQFRSWYEFVISAADDSLYAWQRTGKRCSHDRDTRHSWHGSLDFAETLDMALHKGWPEGKKMLRDSLAIIAPRPDVYQSINYDVAGAVPLVPLAIAGDPAAMMDFGEMAVASQPIVRIDYNHWIHAGTDVQAMMNRGAAVLSLASKLEARGYSTELRIIGNSTWAGDVFRYSVTYKRAGENLDLDRAAFAIAHPSSMRRLAFAILEQHRELERNLHDSYGMPMRQANDTDASVVFIPGPHPRETPEAAHQAVEDAAAAYLANEGRTRRNVA